MDDGATPVEHGGARLPAPNQKFHEISTKLLCLMSAFQHQIFQIFGGLVHFLDAPPRYEVSRKFRGFGVVVLGPHRGAPKPLQIGAGYVCGQTLRGIQCFHTKELIAHPELVKLAPAGLKTK